MLQKQTVTWLYAHKIGEWSSTTGEFASLAVVGNMAQREPGITV